MNSTIALTNFDDIFKKVDSKKPVKLGKEKSINLKNKYVRHYEKKAEVSAPSVNVSPVISNTSVERKNDGRKYKLVDLGNRNDQYHTLSSRKLRVNDELVAKRLRETRGLVSSTTSSVTQGVVESNYNNDFNPKYNVDEAMNFSKPTSNDSLVNANNLTRVARLENTNPNLGNIVNIRDYQSPRQLDNNNNQIYNRNTEVNNVTPLPLKSQNDNFVDLYSNMSSVSNDNSVKVSKNNQSEYSGELNLSDPKQRVANAKLENFLQHGSVNSDGNMIIEQLSKEVLETEKQKMHLEKSLAAEMQEVTIMERKREERIQRENEEQIKELEKRKLEDTQAIVNLQEQLKIYRARKAELLQEEEQYQRRRG